MRVDPKGPRALREAGGAWMRRAVARAEVWMAFAASAAAVFVTLGTAAGVAYAARWLSGGGGR